MSKTVESEVISRRRALSLLGLAAFGLAVPTTVLTVSDAEAQQPAAKPAATAPMTGTERRQERHTRRVRRRVERRKARRKGREERHEMRTGGEEKK